MHRERRDDRPHGRPVDAVERHDPGLGQLRQQLYATENTNGERQQLTAFGLLLGGSAISTPGTGQTLSIAGLEVRLTDAFVSTSCSNSTIGVQLSWDAGTTWSTAVATPNLGSSILNGDYLLGSSSTTSDWGAHTWARNDFSDANFRVR